MNYNDSIFKLWEDFKNSIKYNNRYFPEDKGLIDKLHKILDKLVNYSAVNTSGNFTVYRARIGEFVNELDIRKPNAEKVFIDDKRCNPKGISYFYVASNEDTAIHEVRPEINDVVSVGVFEKNVDLNISMLKNINILEEKLFARTIISDEERCLLDIILNEISKPINSKDSLEYIPVQYIIEYIKQYSRNNSFDGFSFASSFDTGINYVFFDDIKFNLIEIKHVKVNNLILGHNYIKLESNQ